MKLIKAGAHFVIETTRDLPPIVEEINKRMSLGLRLYLDLLMYVLMTMYL
jgi:hypothetical protein